MSGKHTPGKLRIDGVHEVPDITEPSPAPHTVLRSEGERWVALVEITDAEGEANAERLALCWNCHDELKDLLQQIIDLLKQDNERDRDVVQQMPWDEMRAALAKAKGHEGSK